MDEHAEVISAVQTGDLEKLRTLLAQAPSPASARDANGVSAIMHALYRRRKEVLDLLLTTCPTLDIFEATSVGRTERVTELLRRDPNLANAWSADGFTALHFAAFFAQEAIAVQLLEHGADPAAQAKNPMKVMPLHSAAAAHNLAIVRALLEHGAPPNARQERGWTAIHEAAQNGDQAMVRLLLKHGADRSLANDDGTTPLDLATKNGHTEVAKLLAAS
ncbi:MAG: ankyrin repeat domain-containing protein [Acidobacteriia bacterium]|nr:ankyrin repeat domain-containing protein [Terriglobia bacterium]